MPTLFALPLLLAAAPLDAASTPTIPLGANLERFDYPYAVRWFDTRS